jgi:hypothetical protein
MEDNDFILIKSKHTSTYPKEIINKKPNDVLKCELCDKTYTRWNKSKHLKSKYHQLALRLTKKNIH